MSEERLIKKYANRRLYDASQSRHITLDDIRALIVKGEKLKVVEDKTGNDITRHILLAGHRRTGAVRRPILSTKVLEAIIRFYGNSLQGSSRASSSAAIEMFLKQQEACSRSSRDRGAHTPLAAVADLTRQNLEALAKVQESMLNVLVAEAGQGCATRTTSGPERA